jgi:radical SAM protein
VWDYLQKPLLVFWETTRACDLACRHCRASAQPCPLPGELNTAEARALIDQIVGFGRPYPVFIMTGGDALKRRDLFELIEYARSKGVHVSVSPSVTPLLHDETLLRLAAYGVDGISLSLDGADPTSHDHLRGYAGIYERTLHLASLAVQARLKVQINTTVMGHNVHELPAIFETIHGAGVHVWEVFFLVGTGRGIDIAEPTPEMCESVCHFLYQASHYGVTVRTVEAPFFRRVVAQYAEGREKPPDALGLRLIRELERRMGPQSHRARAASAGTRDGHGIVFVSHCGDVTPSGFLPVVCGNVREKSLRHIYTTDPLFIKLRTTSALEGRCGQCRYRDLCGGSRARAYARTGNPLAEDPDCLYRETEAVC